MTHTQHTLNLASPPLIYLQSIVPFFYFPYIVEYKLIIFVIIFDDVQSNERFKIHYFWYGIEYGFQWLTHYFPMPNEMIWKNIFLLLSKHNLRSPFRRHVPLSFMWNSHFPNGLAYCSVQSFFYLFSFLTYFLILGCGRRGRNFPLID